MPNGLMDYFQPQTEVVPGVTPNPGYENTYGPNLSDTMGGIPGPLDPRSYENINNPANQPGKLESFLEFLLKADRTAGGSWLSDVVSYPYHQSVENRLRNQATQIQAGYMEGGIPKGLSGPDLYNARAGAILRYQQENKGGGGDARLIRLRMQALRDVSSALDKHGPEYAKRYADQLGVGDAYDAIMSGNTQAYLSGQDMRQFNMIMQQKRLGVSEQQAATAAGNLGVNQGRLGLQEAVAQHNINEKAANDIYKTYNTQLLNMRKTRDMLRRDLDTASSAGKKAIQEHLDRIEQDIQRTLVQQSAIYGVPYNPSQQQPRPQISPQTAAPPPLKEGLKPIGEKVGEKKGKKKMTPATPKAEPALTPNPQVPPHDVYGNPTVLPDPSTMSQPFVPPPPIPMYGPGYRPPF